MTNHRCGLLCVCPVHKTPLLYSAASDDHACQVTDCPNAQGFRHIAPDLEVTITADTSRLETALANASRAMSGLGLLGAGMFQNALREISRRQAENARTQQVGRDIGLTRQETDDIIGQVLKEADRRWTQNLTIGEIYREARRGLHAHVSGQVFHPFEQGLDQFLEAFTLKPDDGNGRPNLL